MAVLSGKGAIVTGGSRGIGRAITERLAGNGARVAFSYHTEATAAAEVARTVAANGGTARAFRADFGVPDEVRNFLAAARTWLDGFDILVNNAAASWPALIADVSEDDYDRTMTVNAKAVFLAIQDAARHMRDDGRIITLSTINTVMQVPACSVYVGSKGAVEQFTAVAARELGVRGITANSVSPGFTDTDLLRAVNPEDSLREAAKLSVFGRLGRPSDLADVVDFLTGPGGAWMTGQNIQSNGGIV
jgi:3-oxoacyl-[acyl-carrier protein] reductase